MCNFFLNIYLFQHGHKFNSYYNITWYIHYVGTYPSYKLFRYKLFKKKKKKKKIQVKQLSQYMWIMSKMIIVFYKMQ